MVVPAVHSSSPDIKIDARRLYRIFGSTRAVNDVSFEVGAGQVYGFIGPNGAGKTTTMRILSTLDLPDYGDALVDGFSVINDPDRVRRRLGFMPDGFGTYPNMTCIEYLDFFARAYGIIGRERMRTLRFTLAYTGLDKIAEKPVRSLSKGMRQRLCLGRAMIHNPTVLILDEPANGLDPRARIELRNMLRGLAQQGKALLVSSHILTELGEMCDAIGIIEQGKLIVTGTVTEIRRQLQPQVTVRVHLLGRGEELAAWLQRRGEPIHAVSASAENVEFKLSGDDPQARHQLLQQMIEERFPVVDFSAQRSTLEDVFMHLTTGAVQ
ncbi:MAG: multidrug ABC transporter ATP-binding protein [Pirellulaceae bacterium]|nr:MAG: multidrug ABC transporter ATP-binding protein [Pirellulaceae bacterium]